MYGCIHFLSLFLYVWIGLECIFLIFLPYTGKRLLACTEILFHSRLPILVSFHCLFLPYSCWILHIHHFDWILCLFPNIFPLFPIIDSPLLTLFPSALPLSLHFLTHLLYLVFIPHQSHPRILCALTCVGWEITLKCIHRSVMLVVVVKLSAPPPTDERRTKRTAAKRRPYERFRFSWKILWIICHKKLFTSYTWENSNDSSQSLHTTHLCIYCIYITGISAADVTYTVHVLTWN